MATTFDPYHRWLSIPPANQPPNHYRLLGLCELEASVEVIENAAERQISHVLPHLRSPLRPYATNLIRELDAARRCMLDPEAKLAYDAWLKQQINHRFAEPAPRRWQSPSGGESRVNGASPAPSISTFAPTIHAASRPRPKSTGAVFAFLILWLAGAAVGLLAGYAVLCMLDPKYDFLHLMFRAGSVSPSAPPASVGPAKPSLPDVRSVPMDQQFPQSIPAAPSRPGTKDLAVLPPNVGRSWQNRAPQIQPAPPSAIQPKRLAAPPRTPNFDLPAVLPLPPTHSPGQTALVTIPLDVEDARFGLLLIQGSHFDEGQLTLVPETTFDRLPGHWNVLWTLSPTESPKAGELEPTVLGTFSLNGSQLHYTWAAEPNASGEWALRNSLLSIQIYDVLHDAALRAPVTLPALVIDLEKPVSFAVCKCDGPPDVEAVQVEITDVSKFPPHRLEGPPLWRLSFKDESRLTYPKFDKVTTHISVVKRGSRSALEIVTRYQLPSGYKDSVTVRGGNIMLKELKGRLALLMGLALPADQPQLLVRQNEIAATQRNLTALERVAELARQLDKKVEVPFRFYFQVDGREIDLAVSKPSPAIRRKN